MRDLSIIIVIGVIVVVSLLVWSYQQKISDCTKNGGALIKGYGETYCVKSDVIIRMD